MILTKPKELAEMTDKKLCSEMLTMCTIMAGYLEAMVYATTFEREQDLLEEARDRWSDIKRCHREIAKRKMFDAAMWERYY